MGWVEYSYSRGIGINYSNKSSKIIQPFADDPLVRFFFTKKNLYICYIIKELIESEKQKLNNDYKFIIMDYDPEVIKKISNPIFEITEFKSNNELFTLVLKNQAYNNEYQRYFTINNILNEKN